MDSVNDDSNNARPRGGKRTPRSDNHTIIAIRSQLTLHCRASGFIRPDQTEIGLPSAFSELFHRYGDAGVIREVILVVCRSVGFRSAFRKVALFVIAGAFRYNYLQKAAWARCA